MNMLKAFHVRTEAVGYMEEDVLEEGVLYGRKRLPQEPNLVMNLVQSNYAK